MLLTALYEPSPDWPYAFNESCLDKRVFLPHDNVTHPNCKTNTKTVVFVLSTSSVSRALKRRIKSLETLNHPDIWRGYSVKVV